jgi:hypothetical protein
MKRTWKGRITNVGNWQNLNAEVIIRGNYLPSLPPLGWVEVSWDEPDPHTCEGLRYHNMSFFRSLGGCWELRKKKSPLWGSVEMGKPEELVLTHATNCPFCGAKLD